MYVKVVIYPTYVVGVHSMGGTYSVHTYIIKRVYTPGCTFPKNTYPPHVCLRITIKPLQSSNHIKRKQDVMYTRMTGVISRW